MRYLSFFLLLFTLPASAATFNKYPCTAIPIMNEQGRPVPNAVVAVQDSSTGVAVSVFQDPEGTIPFNLKVPPSTILQFYADPGIYEVNVGAAGITRVFFTVCGAGVPSSTRLISIDRTADTYRFNTSAPAEFDCATTDKVCVVHFSSTSDEGMVDDFLMPSFPAEFVSMKIGWLSPSGSTGKRTVWQFEWCAYANGAAECSVSNAQTFTSTSTGDSRRVDVDITDAGSNINWNPNEHIKYRIRRMATNANDDLDADADFQNFRVEFERQ